MYGYASWLHGPSADEEILEKMLGINILTYDSMLCNRRPESFGFLAHGYRVSVPDEYRTTQKQANAYAQAYANYKG